MDKPSTPWEDRKILIAATLSASRWLKWPQHQLLGIKLHQKELFFFWGGGQIEGSKLKHSQTSKSILEMNFQTDLILELKKPKNPMGEKRRPETSSWPTTSKIWGSKQLWLYQLSLCFGASLNVGPCQQSLTPTKFANHFRLFLHHSS